MSQSALEVPAGSELKLLPYGNGRSYGDCCLNDGGLLLRTRRLNQIISLDTETGIIECEPGVTLDEVLTAAVPQGYFLNASPGTKFATVGGAIANDVYGKNHASVGTFGRSTLSFELRRSDGSVLQCSPEENESWFRATVGGLGLTGLITKARFQLKPIANSYLSTESHKVGNLNAMLDLIEESHDKFEYVVGWIDGTKRGARLGQGLLLRANADPDPERGLHGHRGPYFDFPFDMPFPIINNLTIKLLNIAYGNQQLGAVKRGIDHYDSFYYPLDAIGRWNRICGRKGFFQYQAVVPRAAGRGPIQEILERATKAGQGTFLVNVRDFGDLKSPGMLSFPMPGLGIELDYYNKGESTRALFREFDAIIRSAGGRLNCAKDACMTAEDFGQFFPGWEDYSRHIDPSFSSDLYRRLRPDLS